jgi:starvation-inducible outer membrane lipoprotein
VDGPRSSRGWSARHWWTVRGVLADSPPGAMGNSDNHCLRVFTVGIQTWTVRVFDITSSNGNGEYKYSMPGLGEPLLAL